MGNVSGSALELPNVLPPQRYLLRAKPDTSLLLDPEFMAVPRWAASLTDVRGRTSHRNLHDTTVHQTFDGRPGGRPAFDRSCVTWLTAIQKAPRNGSVFAKGCAVSWTAWKRVGRSVQTGLGQRTVAPLCTSGNRDMNFWQTGTETGTISASTTVPIGFEQARPSKDRLQRPGQCPRLQNTGSLVRRCQRAA